MNKWLLLWLTAPRITYGSLKGNPRSMPCLNCLVSWPALLQNMKAILTLGLRTTKEQQGEVLQLCAVITAAFPEVYTGKKWTAKDRWTMNGKSSLISCEEQGLAPRSLPPGFRYRIEMLHLRTLKIQAIIVGKGDRDMIQPIYVLTCLPEVHWCVQSSSIDTTLPWLGK